MTSSRRLRFQREYLRQRFILYGVLTILGVIVFGFIVSFLLFAWYAKDLPSPGKLSQATGYSTVFYDRDGKVLYDMYKDKNRVPVSLSEIPESLKQATIAIEDKNFYKHKGISEFGILRAFFNIIFKRRLEGGSTITQQLIKTALLDPQRTISRKIREMILSLAVENRYSKDQILEMYLNEAPYGGNFWGVSTAAKGYFDKKPSELTLIESAFLAGLPQGPSLYSPFVNKGDLWRGRTKDVLRRMREDGYIDKTREQKALKELENMNFTSPKIIATAPHFIFYVKGQIEKEYGSAIFDQGIAIKTTLSYEVQEIVEKIVKEEVEKIKSIKATNAAVVVLDSQSGDILGMAGSYDYNDDKYGKFNAALGFRQPGSAIKPIVYALAFEKGYTPSTVLMDVKTVFPDQGEKDYEPVNYDGKYRGPMQIRFALGNSENIPAVKLLAMVGLRDFLQKASDMGLETLAPTEENMKRFGLSISLGGGEVTLVDLTSAFSVFARGGEKKNYRSLLEIKDFKGKKLYQAPEERARRVLSKESSFLISHILSDNNARLEIFGPASYLNIPGKTVAVKTGTTNDKRDNWAVGYTKGITIGVWAGNNDNSPMDARVASGATGASSIWYRLMGQILRKYSDGIMDKPDTVEAITVDSYLGGLPKDSSQTRSEYFKKGTEPKDISPFYKKLKISKANGKIANEVEAKTGNYEEKDFVVFTENDPISTDGRNRWQEGIDVWVRDQNNDKFKAPTDVSDASVDDIVVSIKSPSHQTRVDSNTVNIRAKITSVAAIQNVKVFLNGVEIMNFNENKSDIDETRSISDGVYELKVTARNEKGKSSDSSVKFGVNTAWDSAVSLTPTPSPTPTP